MIKVMFICHGKYAKVRWQRIINDMFNQLQHGYISPNADIYIEVTCHVETVVLMSRPLTEHEKYGEYSMNRNVSDIMSEYSEQHDEWHTYQLIFTVSSVSDSDVWALLRWIGCKSEKLGFVRLNNSRKKETVRDKIC